MTQAEALNQKDGAAPQSALTGLRVIDLSRVLGGPYCTQILGDHGADVIKVEPPAGDETRGWGPPFVGDTAAYFQSTNRNKRGIVLDLSQPQQRAVLLHLLEDADIVVENFKTGTMERWGLGYEALAERFPRLIHCRISGFGADGPMGGLPGYDAAAQAMTGLMTVNGEPGSPPLRLGVPIVDMVTGLNAAIGILMAVQERGRSGRGQFVESTLFDCGLSIQQPHMANYLISGNPPVKSGNAHPSITPYEVFETATTPVFLAVGNDSQFRKLCEHFGRPELAADPRFVTVRHRNENRPELLAAVVALFATQDGPTLARTLMDIGVPCAPVLTVPDVARHPHTAHRKMLVAMDDYRGVASPIVLSRTPAQYRRKPPALGEHTLDILGGKEAVEAAVDK